MYSHTVYGDRGREGGRMGGEVHVLLHICRNVILLSSHFTLSLVSLLLTLSHQISLSPSLSLSFPPSLSLSLSLQANCYCMCLTALHLAQSQYAWVAVPVDLGEILAQVRL